MGTAVAPQIGPKRVFTQGSQVPGEEMVLLRAVHAGLSLVVEHGLDTYGVSGGLQRSQGGTYVKFRDGFAHVPESLMPQLEELPAWGTSIWRADDLAYMARGAGSTSPQVADGMQTAGRKAAPPPIPTWDTMGVAELKAKILQGGIADPKVALAYETSHRCREQIMVTLAQIIAQAKAQPGDEVPPAARRGRRKAPPDEASAAVPEPPEPPSADIPADTRGV